MAQENDAALVSIEDTVSFCQKHSDDFKDIPGFSENIHDLDGLAKQLHTIKQALEESTREYTEQKDVSLSVAISTTVTNTEIGLAYYGDHRDLIVPDALKVSKRTLERLRESTLADACRKVFNFCVEHASDFLSYGFTQQISAKTEADIADFELKLAGTPKFKHEQGILKARYDADMAAATDLLDNTIDPKAKLVKRVSMAIYEEYLKTRAKHLGGAKKLAMKGQLTDAATGLPLAGAKLTITKISNEDGTPTTGNQIVTRKKKPSKNGRWFERNSTPGGYSFTVILPGYTAPNTTAYVVAGQTTVVNIKLTKKTN